MRKLVRLAVLAAVGGLLLAAPAVARAGPTADRATTQPDAGRAAAEAWPAERWAPVLLERVPARSTAPPGSAATPATQPDADRRVVQEFRVTRPDAEDLYYGVRVLVDGIYGRDTVTVALDAKGRSLTVESAQGQADTVRRIVELLTWTDPPLDRKVRLLRFKDGQTSPRAIAASLDAMRAAAEKARVRMVGDDATGALVVSAPQEEFVVISMAVVQWNSGQGERPAAVPTTRPDQPDEEQLLTHEEVELIRRRIMESNESRGIQRFPTLAGREVDVRVAVLPGERLRVLELGGMGKDVPIGALLLVKSVVEKQQVPREIKYPGRPIVRLRFGD